ncbi:hypothetical protein Vadar_027813 [Vaccinium darrowii]|uniref:Uncharacterized protein n=1 Tax=Vaccinium darrowii TaxID=229202 RepID=A0ACB7ZN81_9ERIC|nr:hypothetical protein Vadar_027813 [Vaccinium darrowii]
MHLSSSALLTIAFFIFVCSHCHLPKPRPPTMLLSAGHYSSGTTTTGMLRLSPSNVEFHPNSVTTHKFLSLSHHVIAVPVSSIEFDNSIGNL